MEIKNVLAISRWAATKRFLAFLEFSSFK